MQQAVTKPTYPHLETSKNCFDKCAKRSVFKDGKYVTDFFFVFLI